MKLNTKYNTCPRCGSEWSDSNKADSYSYLGGEPEYECSSGCGMSILLWDSITTPNTIDTELWLSLDDDTDIYWCDGGCDIVYGEQRINDINELPYTITLDRLRKLLLLI